MYNCHANYKELEVCSFSEGWENLKYAWTEVAWNTIVNK